MPLQVHAPGRYKEGSPDRALAVMRNVGSRHPTKYTWDVPDAALRDSARLLKFKPSSAS